MNRYCAFLRGINVNGRKMAMKDICSAFEGAEMKRVSSVLATGNILFTSYDSAATLRPKLEKALSDYYNNRIDLFLKDADQISAIVAAVPFEENSAFHIYAFLCEPGFEKTLKDEFDTISPIAGEEAAIGNGNFYWKVPKGSTLDAGFSKILGRKDMKDKLTSRNISTIRKLQEKI